MRVDGEHTCLVGVCITLYKTKKQYNKRYLHTGQSPMGTLWILV